LWSGEIEEASKFPIWEVIKWKSADQMRHLKRFILSESAKYQRLVPAANLLTPSRTGKPKSCLGWAYCARTVDRTFFMLYFEKECPPATLIGATGGAKYVARWFDPRIGKWIGKTGTVLTADAKGKITLPPFPDGAGKSNTDWALKLKLPIAPRPANCNMGG